MQDSAAESAQLAEWTAAREVGRHCDQKETQALNAGVVSERLAGNRRPRRGARFPPWMNIPSRKWLSRTESAHARTPQRARIS